MKIKSMKQKMVEAAKGKYEDPAEEAKETTAQELAEGPEEAAEPMKVSKPIDPRKEVKAKARKMPINSMADMMKAKKAILD